MSLGMTAGVGAVNGEVISLLARTQHSAALWQRVGRTGLNLLQSVVTVVEEVVVFVM